MGIFDAIKLGVMKDEPEEIVEAKIVTEKKPRLKLGLMVIERYADVEKVLDRFRNRDIVLLLKVTPLKTKAEELRKVVDRLKAHCNATGADVAALDENWLLLVPDVVEIVR